MKLSFKCALHGCFVHFSAAFGKHGLLIFGGELQLMDGYLQNCDFGLDWAKPIL